MSIVTKQKPGKAKRRRLCVRVPVPRTLRRHLRLCNVQITEQNFHKKLQPHLSIKTTYNQTSSTSSFTLPVVLDTLIFSHDIVMLHGQPLVPAVVLPHVLIAWNKPKNMTIDTSIDQPFRRIIEELKTTYNITNSLHPVGQLDKNTTGLYLFTTNGDMSNYLCLPGCVEKTYEVSYVAPIHREPTPEMIQLLCQEGIDVSRASDTSKVVVKANSVRLLSIKKYGTPFVSASTCTEGKGSNIKEGKEGIEIETTRQKYIYKLELCISSGANHIVKRLIAGVGLPPVFALHRTKIGSLSIDKVCVSDTPYCVLQQEDRSLLYAERNLVTLKLCRLLCRYRENNKSTFQEGTCFDDSDDDVKKSELLQVQRLGHYLEQNFRLGGTCYQEFPSLKCRSKLRLHVDTVGAVPSL